MSFKPIIATHQWFDKTFDKSFLIICVFYFLSYWFFSFWVMQNSGVYWDSPLGIPHHPFNMHYLDTNFFQTVTYLFVQSPFYSVLTWAMLKLGPAHELTAYLILHYIVGFFAIFSIYSILKFLKIKKWLITISLCYFVFNPFFYRAFSSGFYDFLSMCLVSILAYRFLKLITEFNNKNCFYFFFTLMILCSYRNLFSPILFFIPITGWLLLQFRQRWRSILLWSSMSLAIVLLPYVKNYIIFNTFDVGIGQFATAFKSTTYQYAPYNIIMDDIKKGRLSSLVLCYNPEALLDYKGEYITSPNCLEKISPGFPKLEVEKLVAEKPSLRIPEVLKNENNSPMGGDYLPNTLAGLVVAKQLSHDAKQFIRYHPKFYINRVIRNIAQLTRSNNKYEFNIPHNLRKYPRWFRSRFIYDFLQFNYLYDTGILIGFLATLTFGLLYIGKVNIRNQLSLIHFIIMLVWGVAIKYLPFLSYFQASFLNFTLLWSGLFILPALFFSIKENLQSQNSNSHLLFAFMLFVTFYCLIIVDLVPGSEQERYRFTVEGLLLAMFLFWIQQVSGYFNRPNRKDSVTSAAG